MSGTNHCGLPTLTFCAEGGGVNAGLGPTLGLGHEDISLLMTDVP